MIKFRVQLWPSKRKTKQLERDFYNYLTDSEQIELDLSTFIKELETSIETLSNLKRICNKIREEMSSLYE